MAALLATTVVCAAGPARLTEEARIRIHGPGFRTPSLVRPVVADWNADGLHDLILSQYAGPILVYLRGPDGAFRDAAFVEVNKRAKWTGYSEVCVTDWNADGKLDFLIDTDNKTIELFLNTGTPSAPAFDDGPVHGFGEFKQGAKLTADGRPIAFDDRISGLSAADWNADGRTDLLVGDGSGRVWLFLNQGETGRPALGAKAPVDAGGQATLGDSHHACPAAGDWDGDGRTDLAVSAYARGEIFLYLNQGTPAAPELAQHPKGALRVPFAAVSAARPNPCLADWDGDGRVDLLVGAGGEVCWFRNLGTGDNPREEGEPGFKLDAARRLVGRDFSYRSFLTLSFADLNDDGLDDILAGSYNRALHFYMNTGAKGEPRFGAPCRGIGAPTNSSKAMGVRGPSYSVRNLQPFPYDWNRDGVTDLVFGSRPGDVFLLQNFGAKGRPGFDMTRDKGFNRLQLCRLDEGWSVPIVTDWDRDAIPDLIVGGASGRVYLALNHGQTYGPHFPRLEPLRAGHGEMRVEKWASPFMTDWDHDGFDDLLVGAGTGEIHLFRFDPGARAFAAGAVLESDAGPILTRQRARPWATDWNADGVRDLVVIGRDDYPYCYISRSPPSAATPAGGR